MHMTKFMRYLEKNYVKILIYVSAPWSQRKVIKIRLDLLPLADWFCDHTICLSTTEWFTIWVKNVNLQALTFLFAKKWFSLKNMKEKCFNFTMYTWRDTLKFFDLKLWYLFFTPMNFEPSLKHQSLKNLLIGIIPQN